MKDVILTTDLYHRHADPNDHWNLATMYSLANLGWIKFAGIMCDDDRALRNDGSIYISAIPLSSLLHSSTI